MTPGRTVALNLLGSQAGWFATVLVAAHGRPGWAAAVGAAFVCLHLAVTPHRKAEILVVAAATAVGAAWDSLMVACGLLVYLPGQWTASLAPLWIVMLWALFATTINVSMRWLHGRWLAAALFGALGGPLSFLAGAKLGAVRMPDPTTSLVVLAVGWALLMPLLVYVAMQIDRRAQHRIALSHLPLVNLHA